jgi:hypothetical protein
MFGPMVFMFAMAALGVYATMRLLDAVMDAPQGFLPAVEMGISLLAAWLVGEAVWWGPTIAGLAYGWSLVADLLLYIVAWVKLAPLRHKRS